MGAPGTGPAPPGTSPPGRWAAAGPCEGLAGSAAPCPAPGADEKPPQKWVCLGGIRANCAWRAVWELMSSVC